MKNIKPKELSYNLKQFSLLLSVLTSFEKHTEIQNFRYFVQQDSMIMNIRQQDKNLLLL